MQTTHTGIDAFIRRSIVVAASIAASGMALAMTGLFTTI